MDSDERSVVTWLTVAVIVLFVLIGLGWVLAANDWKMAQVFAPKMEAVRHETFECSVSHADGLVRELRQIKAQYVAADTAGKAALADIYAHEREGYTCNDYPLPSDLPETLQ
jgi:hypothetical protein